MNPDVPTGPALVVGVSAEIAVGELRGDEFARDAVHQRFEARVVGVEPGVGGGVEEFAGVLAGPILRAGAMLEAIDEGLLVDVQEAAFEIDAHAVAEDAVDVLTDRRRRTTKRSGTLSGMTGDFAGWAARAGSATRVANIAVRMAQV